MHSVCVRDHFMIAHSLEGEVFGAAQQLHGATYVVDVELRRPELDADGVVVDIGRATKLLRSVLAELSYRNLDEEDAFSGTNTTSEFLAFVIFQRVLDRVRDGALGPSALLLASMRVTLHESHVASAAYEGRLDEDAEV